MSLIGHLPRGAERGQLSGKCVLAIDKPVCPGVEFWAQFAVELHGCHLGWLTDAAEQFLAVGVVSECRLGVHVFLDNDEVRRISALMPVVSDRPGFVADALASALATSANSSRLPATAVSSARTMMVIDTSQPARYSTLPNGIPHGARSTRIRYSSTADARALSCIITIMQQFGMIDRKISCLTQINLNGDLR